MGGEEKVEEEEKVEGVEGKNCSVDDVSEEGSEVVRGWNIIRVDEDSIMFIISMITSSTDPLPATHHTNQP